MKSPLWLLQITLIRYLPTLTRVIRHHFFINICFSSCVFRVRKILNLRLFEDENGRAWSKSVMDRNFEVLCVSQFTLQCILKANKPDFHSAMPAELAQPFYNSILENMRSTYKPELIKGGWTELMTVGP